MSVFVSVFTALNNTKKQRTIRGDNALSRKKDQNKHDVHNTVTKHAYPSSHQRTFAYTNIIWLGSIVRVFFITLIVF